MRILIDLWIHNFLHNKNRSTVCCDAPIQWLKLSAVCATVTILLISELPGKFNFFTDKFWLPQALPVVGIFKENFLI